MDEELKAIVQRMIDAGEPESNIALVIKNYKPVTVKKKEPTVLPSGQNGGNGTSVIQQQEKQEPSASSDLKDNIFTGYPGKGAKKYKLDASGNVPVWKEYSSTLIDEKHPEKQGIDVYEKPITDPARVAALNKQFKQNASTTELGQTYVGFPGKEKNEYRVVNGIWERKQQGEKEFKPVLNEGSVNALNRQFGQEVVYQPQRAKYQNAVVDAKKETLSKINSKDLGLTEEEFVPKLRSILSNPLADMSMFKVEEIQAGDAVRVTNTDTKEYRDISLDNWTGARNTEESKILKAFLESGSKFSALGEKKKELSTLLEQRMKTPSVEIDKRIDELNTEISKGEDERQVWGGDDKYKAAAVYNKGEVDNLKSKYAGFQKSATDLKTESEELDKYQKETEALVNTGQIGLQEYNEKYLPEIQDSRAKINEKAVSLQGEAKHLVSQSSNLNRIAGQNILVQQERGNIATGTIGSFAKGAESVLRFALPEDVNKGSFADVFTPGVTTPEYMTSEKRSDFEKAIFGISESLGAAVTGGLLTGGTASVPGLFASSYMNAKDQFDQPGMENIPEYKKILYSATVGVANAALEEIGLGAMFGKTAVGSKFINSMIGKTFKDLPKDASAEMIELAIKSNIKTAVLKSGINVATASLTEGATEALQELATITAENTFNWMEDKNYFDTPNTAGEILDRMGEAAKLGMIGGSLMSSVSQTTKLAKDQVTLGKLNDIETLISDTDLKDIFKTTLKSEVMAGVITKDEAMGQLNNLAQSESTLREIPKGVKPEQKLEAFKLISEQKQLQKEITGMNPDLVVEQKNRIKAISEELQALSINDTKTKEDAITESEKQQQASTAESNIQEYKGAESGQQEIGTAEGSQREAPIAETNISDSNQSGKIQEEIKPVSEATKLKERRTTAKQAEVSDPTRIAAQYFLNGGKINRQGLESLLGGGGKKIQEEVNRRFNLLSKDDKLTVDGVAHMLWEQNKDVLPQFDDTVYRDAVEQILTSSHSADDLTNLILEQDKTEQSDQYYDELAKQEAEAGIEPLSDRELQLMSEEATAAEKAFIEDIDAKLQKKSTHERIGDLLDRAIIATSTKGKAYDATLGIPLSVLNASLKVVKAAHTATGDLAVAIQKGYEYLTKQGHTVSEKDYKSMIDTELDTAIEQLDVKIEDNADTDVLIAESKKKGIKDEEIVQFLKTKGVSNKDARAKVLEYNEKQEGIFLPVGDTALAKFKSTILKYKKMLFSAKRFLPKSVFAEKEYKDGKIASDSNQVYKTVADFNRAYRNFKGTKEQKDQVVKNFDKKLRGDKNVILPDDFEIIANTMRNQIDMLSIDLINSGMVSLEEAKTIYDNLGTYLNRSFEVWDNKNWKKKLTEEQMQMGRNVMMQQESVIKKAKKEAETKNMDYQEALENLARLELDKLLTKDDSSGKFFKPRKLGSKDASNLKRRNDIPAEIRELMGEYADPALNYAKTVLKLSSLVANNHFLTQIKKAGEGVYFFNESDANRPAQFNTEIAAKGSESMNPLDGMYTTPEIAKEFKGAHAAWDVIAPWLRVVSFIKWRKTIGSVPTHAKNIVSNAGFVLQNGHLDFKEMAESYKVIKNDFLSLDNKEFRKKYAHYASLNLVGQSSLNEVKDMFKEEQFDQAMADRISGGRQNIFTKMKRLVSKGKKRAEDLYSAEDDFFKILAYEVELSRYSKAVFGKDKNDLTEEQRVEVDKEVAEIVKNTYPTYSRIPEAIQMIARFPLVGTFVAFQAESYRTAYNTMALIKEELKSENPEIRKIGAKRLAAASSYATVKTALLSAMSYGAGLGLTGVLGYMFNDDEEDKKNKAVRSFVPWWVKNSDLKVSKAEDGKLIVTDLSSSDPRAGINKALNAFYNGESTIDSFSKALVSTVEPFIGTEMSVQTLLSLKNNEDAYGNPIYNTEASKDSQMEDISAYIFKIVQTGTTSSALRIYNSENKGAEVFAALTGFRTYEIDVAKQFGYKMSDYRDRLAEAKRIYNSAKYDEDATKEDREAKYEEANKSLNRIYSDIKKEYASAVLLGCKPYELRQIMKERGAMNQQNLTMVQADRKFKLAK